MSDSQSDTSHQEQPRQLRTRKSRSTVGLTQEDIARIIDGIRRTRPKRLNTPSRPKRFGHITPSASCSRRPANRRSSKSNKEASASEQQPDSEDTVTYEQSTTQGQRSELEQLERVEHFVHTANTMEAQESINNLSTQIAALTNLVENMSLRIGQLEKVNTDSTRPQEQPSNRQHEQTILTEENLERSRVEYDVDQRIVQTLKTIKPPSFNGDTAEAVTWLLAYNEVAETNLWSPSMKVRQVSQALELGAKSWYRTTWRNRMPSNWTEFEECFKTTFLRGSISDHLRMRLSNLKQKPDEDLLQYFLSSVELCILADAHMPECQQINYIIDGMNPRARTSIRMTRPRTILDLQESIKVWLADHYYATQPSGSQLPRRGEITQAPNRQPRQPFMNSDPAVLAAILSHSFIE
jgi:hypothetical protein